MVDLRPSGWIKVYPAEAARLVIGFKAGCDPVAELLGAEALAMHSPELAAPRCLEDEPIRVRGRMTPAAPASSAIAPIASQFKLFSALPSGSACSGQRQR